MTLKCNNSKLGLVWFVDCNFFAYIECLFYVLLVHVIAYYIPDSSFCFAYFLLKSAICCSVCPVINVTKNEFIFLMYLQEWIYKIYTCIYILYLYLPSIDSMLKQFYLQLPFVNNQLSVPYTVPLIIYCSGEVCFL